MKFGNTDYTKDELIALALKMAAQRAKEWRNAADDSESWDHYDGLLKAFEAIQNESKEG